MTSNLIHSFTCKKIPFITLLCTVICFFLQVQHWLNQLCEELSERLQSNLEQNKRIARTLTLHARAYKGDLDSHKNLPSKSCPLRYGAAKIQGDAVNLFQAGLREYIGFHNNKGSQNSSWGITSLSVGASKMVTTPSVGLNCCVNISCISCVQLVASDIGSP
ncbi:DNA polymerase eta-like [Neltuma alba]|uniref:DNA polymerase eta-like n=1 Tax=Neltuma alba TaxID=207710 RepID=UPI0010A42BC0|nr:DNA polymerase eta-like [Prosopis alba]